MSVLWTPPGVRREKDVVARDTADIRLAAALRGQLDWWNRELKAIDENLEMVWFDDGVDIVGVVPNRYHVLRVSPDPTVPVNIIPITDDEGGFVEPNSAVFDRLRAGDMWNDRAVMDREKRRADAQAAAERQRERETEDRQAEILERWVAATRAQVSFGDAPWSQNMSPAARRDAGERTQKKQLRNGASAA